MRAHTASSRVRILSAALGGLALLAAQPSTAAETWPDNMPCGADLPRADRTGQSALQTLDLGERRITYVRMGQGSPVLLITGYRSTMAEWNAYFLQALAARHEVIAFDHAGVGGSTGTGDRTRIEAMAGDVSALIRRLGLHQVTVLGWSMGGMVAQQAALDDRRDGSGRIARLVLMTSMPPGPAGIPVDAPTLRTLSGGGAGHFGRVMRALFPPASVARAERCFVADMFAPRGYTAEVPDAVARAQAQAIDAWRADRTAARRLGRLKIPVLVVTGGADTVLPPANAQAFARLLPQARSLELRDGGHALMYQYPYALAGRIDSFIRETTRQAPGPAPAD